VFHLGRRDFVCTETGCEEAFGYKHLLQRHTAKIHAAHTSDSGADEGHSPNEDDAASLINAITGQKFAARSLNPRALRCPHPQPPFEGSYTRNADADACEYWFTRAYDLRRHLLAAHGLDVDKEVVDEWVDDSRAAR
jgi:general transcription factor IIIA